MQNSSLLAPALLHVYPASRLIVRDATELNTPGDLDQDLLLKNAVEEGTTSSYVWVRSIPWRLVVAQTVINPLYLERV